MNNLKQFRKYDSFDLSDTQSENCRNYINNEMFECSIQENDIAYLATSKYTDEFISKINLEQINKDYFLYNLAKKMFIIK